MQSLFLFIFFTILHAGMEAQSLSGEYYLQGIPETASGFRFTKDGKFEFYFIYGAVDRMATGTYALEGKTIKLKSDKEAGKDFPILHQSSEGEGYTIQVQDRNEYLLSNVICLYYIDSIEHIAYSDEAGLIFIDEKKVDRISLLHELFPDVASLIKDESNPNNYFEVGLSPSLAQVSFQGIDFTVKGNTITCLPNGVLPFENIEYVKN